MAIEELNRRVSEALSIHNDLMRYISRKHDIPFPLRARVSSLLLEVGAIVVEIPIEKDTHNAQHQREA